MIGFSGVPSHPGACPDGSNCREERGETDRLERDMPVPGGQADDLDRMEIDWHNRLTYPTGLFDPAWVRSAAAANAGIPQSVPAGLPASKLNLSNSPLALDPNSFTALGPRPLRTTGCSGCFDYGTAEGRVNDIVIDPMATTSPI